MGGLEATREIRKWEEENPTPHAQLRPSSILNGRLPILAGSASLPERERPTIVEAGLGEFGSRFGWMTRLQISGANYVLCRWLDFETD